MVICSFIILGFYSLQNLREIMFTVGTQWLLTLKKKGKIIWIWNEREDFSEKIMLLFVLMALTSPLIMRLSLCST